MKQAGFFDVEERLARLSGLGDQLEAFSRMWILRPSALICRRLWRILTEAKAGDHHLIRY
ncbi:hypothetical protein GCM10007867_29810 [Gluconobacter cerinus]|uniref:Uncharacterized protein n=1 Tax=Gluconobacter cerinus TaxID=38307 RepID=A0AAV5NID3_9PROT|nr:hypothetical protein GCM10007867_29810 [Gluconobacter cerinus]